MITKLDKITIPVDLINEVKSKDPDRVVKHVDGTSHSINVKELGAKGWPVENFVHYDNDRCTIKEYCSDWYKTVVPDNFFQENKLELPKNAIVLRVDPGTFSVPH